MKFNKYSFALKKPLLVGICNFTPDSFSDGGKTFSRSNALKHINAMVKDGAQIIDIGAESSRPGSHPISLDDEKKRLFPILEKVVDLGVPVSVDSNKYEIMEESIKIGSSILNDINGFESDEKIELVENNTVSACIMHKKGTPLKMQENPHYNNLMQDITVYFEKKKLILNIT